MKKAMQNLVKKSPYTYLMINLIGISVIVLILGMILTRFAGVSAVVCEDAGAVIILVLGFLRPVIGMIINGKVKK